MIRFHPALVLLLLNFGCGDNSNPDEPADASTTDGAMDAAGGLDAQGADAEGMDAAGNDAGSDAGPTGSDAGMDMTVPPTELKAFPSAFGAGARSTGGRGGQVIHVTNLNDSGAGSLREALYTTGPRIVVFDVSGEINLASRIYPSGPQYGDLTIAGQSAPEGGITITGSGVNIPDASNIIIRYIRFRGTGGPNRDLLALRGVNSDIIVDHCSFSWATDEALDVSGANVGNLTIQNCHFSNNAKAIILGDNQQSPDAAPIGDMSVLRNTFHNSSHRFPNFTGHGRCDVLNNIVHNFQFRSILLGARDFEVNVIGNYFQTAGNSLSSALNQSYAETWGRDRLISGINKIICNETMRPTLCSKFNHIDQDIIDLYQEAWDSDPFNQESATNNGWTSIDFTDYSETNEFPAWTAFYTEATTQPDVEWFTNEMLPLVGVPQEILLNGELKDALLPTTGASRTLNADGTVHVWRDAIDTDSSGWMDTDTGPNYINQSRPEWGVNQAYTSDTRPADYDTDRDGMPNAWETAMGFDPDVDDGSEDQDDDGYTNLDEFLNMIDQ